MNINHMRSKWAAVGAAVAISLGAGGIGITHATTSTGEKPIYAPIEPCRLADLRPAPFQVGPRPVPLGSNETYTLSGWGTVGDCTLPTGTTGLSLNVTAVDATEGTFLTFFPAAATRPNAANLNPSPGQPPTPNAVNVDLNDAGQFSVYNLQGNVHVIIDVVGVYDDHNHDDRYYTQGQTDQRTNELWGYVVSSGTGFHATSGGVEVSKPATGTYCLRIPSRSSHKATQVTAADPSSARFVSVGTGHGSACNPLNDAGHSAVPVYVRDTTGALIDGNFTFIIPAG